MEKNKLREHMDHIIQCTQELGLSRKTFHQYVRCYEAVFSYCTENALSSFTCQEADAFCMLRCGADPQRPAAMAVKKAAYTVARYFEEGKFSWKTAAHTERYPVSETYRALAAGFRQELSEKLSPGTVRTEMTVVRQFLYFLEQNGVTHEVSITSRDVLDFVRLKSPDYKSSMAKLLRVLRNFVRFLRGRGNTDLDADRFLKTAGRCRQKVLPCFTDDELRAVFSQIDRTTEKGRRDYAVFLLALRTGLRASDISGLKLADICWREKTIRTVQKKTRVSVLLPLPADAGNAIADYILHSRPQVDNPFLFLRLAGPACGGPVHPSGFNAALRGYTEAAGIGRTGWDGKSFHALRRTAGTNMVASGVPVSTVAQILGHRNVESSRRYISLDTESLRQCCLGLGPLYTRKEGLV